MDTAGKRILLAGDGGRSGGGAIVDQVAADDVDVRPAGVRPRR